MGAVSSEGTLDLFEDGRLIYGNTKVLNGNFSYIDSDGATILEISGLLEQDFNKSINMISASYVAEAPTSLGYIINQKEIGDESFALTVLSQDKDYDLCILSSREDFAASIRDKGAFYPLNDVDGVEEYLDACFPFIKEAATNEDGDIWMFPVDVRVMALCYDTEICSAAGLAFSDDMTLQDFISNVKSAYSDGSISYAAQKEFFSELLLSDYLMEYGSFDTPEFRELAETIRTDIWGNEDAFTYSSDYNVALMSGDYSNVAFDILSDAYAYSYHDSDSKTVISLPMAGGKSIATCTFICVNPASEHLEDTLAYISALSKSLAGDKDNLSLAKADIYSTSDFYQAVKEVYGDAQIRFTYSSELYADDFNDYLDGTVSLEDFIAEADRKLSAYKNE
jgi:hypothetical protein